MQDIAIVSPHVDPLQSPDVFEDPQPLHDEIAFTTSTKAITTPQPDTCEDSATMKRLIAAESKFLASRLRVAEKIIEKDRRYRDSLREEQAFRMRQRLASDIDDNNSIVSMSTSMSFVTIPYLLLALCIVLLLCRYTLAAQLDTEIYRQ
ncbi:MAG: hypothetical protein EOO61_06950 [Hymenobacter sp.]|nr:MAG: hypothetical protein EOO61_06950 [Hymenobacter sp.]